MSDYKREQLDSFAKDTLKKLDSLGQSSQDRKAKTMGQLNAERNIPYLQEQLRRAQALKFEHNRRTGRTLNDGR